MSPARTLISARTRFQHRLHTWYAEHHRRLPWRAAPSLYKTVVSEFMLQQTQVATALPFFDRWMRELPDFAALAGASEAQVMKLWEGLGYYSRARNLHRLGQALAARGDPPRDPAAWRELPGVGPYTAAAICSIAFSHASAVVDGNVVRVLARLTGERRVFVSGAAAVTAFTPLAEALVAGAPAGLHNQAMMELGATICFRQSPACERCPVASHCAGRRDGIAALIPRFAPRKIELRDVWRVWCLDDNSLLLRRQSGTARQLAGIHELPEATDLSLRLSADSLVATKRRSITRFRIRELIHAVKPTAGLRRRVTRSASLTWVPLAEIGRVTLSGPHRRWVEELLAPTGST